MWCKVVGDIVVNKIKVEVKTEPSAAAADDDDEDELPLVSKTLYYRHVKSDRTDMKYQFTVVLHRLYKVNTLAVQFMLSMCFYFNYLAETSFLHQ